VTEAQARERTETGGVDPAAWLQQNRVTLVDTHAHLAWKDFSADLTGVVTRAEESGLARILAVGVDDASSAATVAVADCYASVFAGVGLHPNECAGPRGGFATIAALARARHRQYGGPVVAIGESGLDFYRDAVAPAVQQEAFRLHLALAAELDLPIVVHNRQADEAILRMLAAAPAGLRGVMHCFSGDLRFAEACLERGFYLSFAGNVTYRSAAALREVAARVPAERLLIETDAPFLSPHPWRGQRNEPAFVAATLRALCETRGVTETALGCQVVANARDLFGW
jgi:TatD DNase family protein